MGEGWMMYLLGLATIPAVTAILAGLYAALNAFVYQRAEVRNEIAWLRHVLDERDEAIRRLVAERNRNARNEEAPDAD